MYVPLLFSKRVIVLVCLTSFACAADEQGNVRILAEKLLEASGRNRGVCAMLGEHDELALELARMSEMSLHVLTQSDDHAASLRQKAESAGYAVPRFAVERGRTDKLPYVNNLIDILVARGANTDWNIEEMLRVVRPNGTVFFVGTPEEIHSLEKGIRSKDLGSVETRTWRGAAGTWLTFAKPPLDGAGDWTHWENGPDNNPVSVDTIIKAPYMTQFMAEPFFIAMPSITTIAAGRTFLAIGHIAHHQREWNMMNKIVARNGYNGALLWERSLPEGYLVHRSAFIATANTFYMLNQDHCLMLDPETGAEQGTLHIPEIAGHWKWMAMKDGVLYVMSGKPDGGVQSMKGDRTFGGWSWGDLSRGYYQKPHVPWGFGHTLAAFDMNRQTLLWQHGEDQLIDSRGMSLGQDRMFLYCPEKHLRCLNLKSGKIAWTNSDKQVLELIEQEGSGLTSTPGFRSACICVYTPDALIMQGQTRQNVVAISTHSGDFLWTKSKVTNNPNAIYVDGNVVLGVGENGTHLVLDPVSGEVKDNLGFTKTACTRLTACSDSFFVRGEGTLRFDRDTKRILVDGAARPACNDGALPANGLLYVGPWQCDCNLSLIGRIAKCSAGDFEFDHFATEDEHLERGVTEPNDVAPFEVSEFDWPTYRANNQCSASSKASVSRPLSLRWHYRPDQPHPATAPISAGGLIFVGGEDGQLRAIDADTGDLRWQFYTPSPIKAPPTISDGRAFVGSGDGYVYALEAATGRQLWRFRAAPIERRVMIYGSLNSTWPVNSGIVVQDGTAYFAAGIIDYDGTYVYALDAKSGKIKWQNNSSGHLNAELRKGVSAQGNMVVMDEHLLLAGGNQISPATYDRATGKCLSDPFEQGYPKPQPTRYFAPPANHGRFVGVLANEFPVFGGRILYSAPENVASKGNFNVQADGNQWNLCYGSIPPAWNDETVALVNYKHGKITACDISKMQSHLKQDNSSGSRGAVADAFAKSGLFRWQTDLGEPQKFEVSSLALGPDSVVATVQYQIKHRAQTQRYLAVVDTHSGKLIGRQELSETPLPGGLLIDRQGQVVVTTISGSVLCYGKR